MRPAPVIALVLLAGCVHSGNYWPTPRNPEGGWLPEIRNTAAKTYLYAQLSANAYKSDGSHFVLPDDTIEIDRRDNNRRGFAYAVFERRKADGARELILAFRGTESASLKDWLSGNVLGQQNRDGLTLYDAWRARTPQDVPITVTGHSLGGAIATSVSLCRPLVNSYVFNTSPRFSRCRDRRGVAGDRESVVEYGEFLKVFRIFGPKIDQLYTSIGCTSGNPVRQHSIRSLAECLTRIAATNDAGAQVSLARNPTDSEPYQAPPITRGDGQPPIVF